MSNKGAAKTNVASADVGTSLSVNSDSKKNNNSENSSLSSNNSRYSLGGTSRLSFGNMKAGRLSNAASGNNEFSDSGKLSLGGRLSMTANESRNSISR